MQVLGLFQKAVISLFWTLALPSSCGERRNLVTSTRSVEDWRGGSAKASGEDMKYIEGTVSSGGNMPLCVFFHTCVGKPQHLFVWFFHTYVVISTRVCKNTHLCGKNHTDGNCVVCGYYHTHVVKTKHVWK